MAGDLHEVAAEPARQVDQVNALVQELAAAGDLGPEGIRFIPASESPTGDSMLAVANEISGTTTLYSISSVIFRNGFD